MNYFELQSNLSISGDITKEMTVTSITDYYDRLGINSDDETVFEQPEFKAIENIINLQVGYYLLRRASGGLGHITDWYADQISCAKNEFELQFDKPFQDLNADIDW